MLKFLSGAAKSTLMDMHGLRWYLVTLLYTSCVHSYKYGGPDYICKDPLPIHHTYTTQTTPCPFVLSTEITDAENGKVKIQIRSRINSTTDHFTGYYVRVKNVESFLDEFFSTGTFSLDHARGTVRPCKDEKTEFVTHDTNAVKNSIDINWQAPPGFTGDVIFTSTIVESFSLFWMNVESSPITVSRKPEPIQDETNQPLNATLRRMHRGCTETKSCVYTPEYCLANKSCNALLTIKPLNGIFEIEMFSKYSKFVAMGISENFNMGADAVTECVFEEPSNATEEGGGVVKAYRSWNQPRRKENERLKENDIDLIRGVYENELIYCKVHMKPVFKISTYNFDLNKNWYYVTLASGSNLRYFRDKKPGLHYHNRYRVSPEGRFFFPAITYDPNDEFFYQTCGGDTVCHGDPGLCINTKNCRFAGRVRVQDHKFIVSLMAHKSMYVALGFTEDQRRGNDHIVECLNNGTEVQAWRSWNVPDVFDNARMGQTGVQLLNGSLLKDGGLECTLSFDPSVIPSFKLDLDYYFILAAGSTVGGYKVGYHDLARNINNANINLYKSSSQEERDKLFYNGCGESRTCMGHPDGCIDSKSCIYAVSIATDNVRNIFSFHIIGNKSPGYVSVGLSADKFMGDDLVVDCVNLKNGKAKASLAYNEVGKKSKKHVKEKFFMPTYGSFIGEKLECIALIEHPHFTVENKSFDLLQDKYFILLAVGKLNPDVNAYPSTDQLYHDVLTAVSSQAQTLQVFKTIGQRSRVPVLIHAILMVISWLALSSSGVIIARYYKSSKDGAESVIRNWFKLHKYCMWLTSALTIIGVAVIYFYCGGVLILAGPASNHAILGLITTALVILQPLIAIFRPHPHSYGRIFFNIFHWFIGHVSHVVAIYTIYLAVELRDAHLPKSTYSILIAYIIHYVLVHLLLTVISDMDTRECENENEKEIRTAKNGNALKGSQQSYKLLIGSNTSKFKNLVFKYHFGMTFVLVLLAVVLILSDYVLPTSNTS